MSQRAQDALTEVQYWNDVELLSTEIEDAIAIFHTYDEINRLAAEDQTILRVLNEDALFWKVLAYGLQTSLFIVLARIFDSSDDAHSIHKVLNATIGHPEFFSKDALAIRKAQMAGGIAPDWLNSYMRDVWEPQRPEDLRELKRALRDPAKRFRAVYAPIRNRVFAHNVSENHGDVRALFEETRRHEVVAILDNLHDLIKAIEDLYLNGMKPELGQRSYEDHNKGIRTSAERVLRKLVSSTSALADE